MHFTQKKDFDLDKARNRLSKRAIIYLWCYRTACSNCFFIKKYIAKIGIEFFKLNGIGIETKKIGGGLRLPHLNGIFIHGKASLGENCTILQQVTIGANEHRNNYDAAPQIGNRVYIGAGAKIIGDITIGDDVRNGANAVVTKNIPASQTVVGYNKIIETKIERTGII